MRKDSSEGRTARTLYPLIACKREALYQLDLRFSMADLNNVSQNDEQDQADCQNSSGQRFVIKTSIDFGSSIQQLVVDFVPFSKFLLLFDSYSHSLIIATRARRFVTTFLKGIARRRALVGSSIPQLKSKARMETK